MGSPCCTQKDGASIVENDRPASPRPRPVLSQTSVKSTFHDFLYPMYVMPMKTALELKEMVPHQKLLETKKIRQATGDMLIIFLSHQWLGFKHPDESMKQFCVFQEALQNLIAGLEVTMCPFTAAVFSQLKSYLTPEESKKLLTADIWYDFFSIPQVTIRGEDIVQDPNTIAAVDSIPAYVNACQHFFVLAPPELHSDTGVALSLESWGQRGWCRTEMGSHYLSEKEKPSVICITKKDRVVETYPFAWLHNQPRQGVFTVDSDKPKVEKLMASICNARIQTLKVKEKVFEARFLRAMFPWLTGQFGEIETELVQWVLQYGFADPLEAGPLGWAPIHFAALEGNMKVLEALLAKGESINRKAGEGDAPPMGTIDFGMQIPGMTPLMCVAFYVPTGTDATPIAQFLLKNKADMHVTCAGGETALHLAASGAASDACLVDYLIDSKADIEQMNDCSETPLLKACFMCPAGSKFPNTENVKQLVKRGAELKGAASIRPIHPTALRVASGTADSEHIKFLLEHRADVNGVLDYETKPIDFEMSPFPIYISESSIRKCTDDLYAATPLHWAAHFGNRKAADLLMQARADPTMKNYQNNTALDVAKKEDQENVVSILMRT